MANTIEKYILELIKKREKQLLELELNKSEYSVNDYRIMFHRLSGQVSDLYMVLTAHDNTYHKIPRYHPMLKNKI